MSAFRSAATRQSQSQTYANIHKRPAFRGPVQRKTSIASSSVYDPEETPRTRLTLKQAITLITLRLGRLEVFANETKLNGGVRVDSENVDKDFLLSLVTRIDNMEKLLHNLRVDFEKNRQVLNSINETELDLENEPIIIEMMEKINALYEPEKETIENELVDEEKPVLESEEPVLEAEPEIRIIYNPDIIEPYHEPSVEPNVETKAEVEEVQKSKRRVKKK
jgi:hypothetical protein